MYKIKLDGRHKDILILAIIISLSVALVAGMGPAITGFYATAGNEWEGRLEVQATSAEQTVATRVLFSANRPNVCADGIYVEASDGQQIPFKTENEIYLNRVCGEADVSFNNIIYGQDAPPINYLVYYGKIGAAQAETTQEPAAEAKPVMQEEEKPRPAFGAAAFSAAVTFGAKAATTISGCSNITSAGEYNLTASVTNTALNVCMNITASNVTFDCGGNTIDGQDTAGTRGISVWQLTNVTIKNCRLTDWDFGILLSETNSSFVINNTVDSIVNQAIFLNYTNNSQVINNTATSSFFGVYVTRQGQNTILNNSLQNNSEGIELLTSTENTAVNNTIRQNSVVGLLLSTSANDNTILTNYIGFNTDGIRNVGGSQRNEITNNTIRDNTAHGINFDLTSGMGYNEEIKNNTILNNTLTGIWIRGNSASNAGSRFFNNIISNNNEGINITAANSSTFVGNIIQNNRYVGIKLSVAQNHLFVNNIVANNTNWDFFSENTGSNITVINMTVENANLTFAFKDIAIKNSTAPAADPAGFRNITRWLNVTNLSATSFFYVNFTYLASDVGNLGEGNLLVAKYNGTAWNTTTSSFASSSGVNIIRKVVFANITDFAGTYGALAFAPMISNVITGCTNITTQGRYTQSLNIIDSAFLRCIDITAANVTLNGNSFTIDGTKVANSGAINITAANVTIANVTITQWDGPGIRVSTSNAVGIKIQNVTIYDINSGEILLEGGTHNATLNYVNITGTGGIGVDVNSNGAIIANSTIGSTRSDAIRLLSVSSAVIENSAISNSTPRGLEINGGNNHIVRHSFFVNNSRGIRFSSGATRNELYNLTIENNTIGIEIIDANSVGNFSNITLQNNRIADFISTSSAFIPLSNITISFNFTFSATAFNVSIRNATVASIAADPAGFRNMSKYLNITNNSAGAWILINMSYSDAEIPAGLVESLLRILKYNGTSWETNTSLFSSSQSVDTANNVITTNITNFYGNITGQTIFALFAENDTTLPVPSFVAPTPDNASTVNVTSLAINVTVTESNLANITIVLSNSSGIVNTSVSTASPFFLNFTNLAEDVNYTVNATAIDTAGNSNFTARVFVINTGDAAAATTTAASTSGSGAGAGGGGGTGAIGETSATVVIGDIGAGERKAVVFSGRIDVSRITIVAAKHILAAKITVGELIGKPEMVPESAGIVYRYLNIKFPEADSSISKAEIAFRVEKAWLSENNVDKTSIYLARYSPAGWQELLTDIKSEDASYVYYSAETPGFSVFAIIGEKKTAIVAPSAMPVPRQPKVVLPAQTPPRQKLELPKSILNFSKRVAFLLTPASLIGLAVLAAIISLAVRMRPAIKRFMKERAAKRAAEARKPKVVKLVHGAEHYRQARKSGEVAEDLSRDISALERALKKLK